MSGSFLGLVIESLVAVLLALTIFYCLILNRRLARLRADESALRGTIAELVTATEIAERAIAGLKMTVDDCDRTLGERLRTAERFGGELSREIKRGDEVLARIAQIAEAAGHRVRPGEAAQSAPAPAEPAIPARVQSAIGKRVAEAAAAAQAIAARTRPRTHEAA